MSTTRIDGMTLQVFVQDFAAGVEFYSRLFQRQPDFRPHQDFCEWEVFPGMWFQIAAGDARPGVQVRFRVGDIEAEAARLSRNLGVSVSRIERVPGLVALCNFRDPWGNLLGLYEKLFGDSPAVPGGSYRDFEPDPAL